MEKKLTVRGVRVNNLKNIDLTIPRDKFLFIVIIYLREFRYEVFFRKK